MLPRARDTNSITKRSFLWYIRVQTISAMAVNFFSSVPKLRERRKKEIYGDRAFAVQNMLVLDNLKNCLDGTDEDTTKDNKAKAKLILTIDPSFFVHIKDATTKNNLWTKNLFDDTGYCQKIGLLRTMISIRLDSWDSMESM